MRIILYEIKRIFNWKIVLIIALFTAGYYILNMSFDLRDAHSNANSAIYHVNRDLVKKYGTTLDKQELGDLKKSYEKEVQTANAYIKQNRDFTSIGITSYKAFQKMNTRKPQYEKLRKKILFDDQVRLFEELSAQETIIGSYRDIKENIWFFFNCFDQDRTINSAQRTRINQLLKSGELNSAISDTVFDGYDKPFDNEAELIFICVLFLLGMVFISDKKRKVVQLQCSSKTGRNIYHLKIAASLISAFILITVQLALFFAIYLQLDVGDFFNVKLMSFLNTTFVSWYNPSFLQYMFLTVAGTYLIAMCAAVISLVLSKCARNYIVLTATLVLASVLFAGLFPNCMLTKLNTIELPQYLTPAAYAALLLIAAVLPIILWKREKRLDICN